MITFNVLVFIYQEYLAAKLTRESATVKGHQVFASQRG
jgi:hypothetical protein